MAAPDFWSNQNSAKAVLEKVTAERAILNPFRNLHKTVEDAELFLELAGQEKDGAQAVSALADVEKDLARSETMFRELEAELLLNDKLDGSDAFVSLHAGAGGTESCDWAEMLMRMYLRYCEAKGFKTELLDRQADEQAGVKRVTFSVTGRNAYGFLKTERGVHRLVRISPFDANKRRHTSFAAAAVIAALPDDVEVEINEEDLRIDTFRSSGKGGQHVNKTESAVRITHLPTGIVTACQAERSQHHNKAVAMQMLKARLYDMMLEKKRKDMEKLYGEKGEIAWGSQIRSYVLYPYLMVKDHRTEVETSRANEVLDGDLDNFVYARLKQLAGEKRTDNA